MSALDFLSRELAELRARALFRDPAAGPITTADYLNASSNDYLGLAHEEVSRETYDDGLRLGAGASPLIFGRTAAHAALERELSDWVDLPEALIFSSGYATNVGSIAALAGSGDLIISDELNHASIIDGCRLSRAEICVVPHLDVDAVARALKRPARRHWVITESYFSMDGDSPDLGALRELTAAAGAALYVDEAHALGVLGPRGGGLCLELGIKPDVLVGTLGKAVGVQGAFVAGSGDLRTWLWNRARSQVFSTGFSPLLANLVLRNVARVRQAERERRWVADAATQLRCILLEHGARIPESSGGHVIPILVGDSARALAVANMLREAKILVQAIRPPTVPAGLARLRVTINSRMTPADLAQLAMQLVRALAAAEPELQTAPVPIEVVAR